MTSTGIRLGIHRQERGGDGALDAGAFGSPLGAIPGCQRADGNHADGARTG